MHDVKKVYVIHKTHLDIGFTGFAQDVLDRYVKEFIPQAIETAYRCNTDGKRVFVWTVGSYLIHYFLEHADEAGVQRLEQAIRDGYIVWHALPCTTDTEAMSRPLFRYGLSLGRRLEKRFGKAPCIAAKMTDVPCHTVAMLPDLCEYGVQYLHIGINEASRPVEIPELCIWKFGPYEVILNYAGAYGKACIFGDIALKFAHTADNMGPPTPEVVEAEMQRLAEQYPGAEIASSSLDDFARAVAERRDELPVVEAEFGDTWIHGIGSDPWKTAMLCELLRLEETWRGTVPDVEADPNYQKFLEQLLLVCEHTYGMDGKKYLYDYQNWDKAEFARARREDRIGESALRAAGAQISNHIMTQELPNYTNGEFLGSYRTSECSWEEQRGYIHKAVSLLPPALREQAEQVSRIPTGRTVSGTPCKECTFEIAGHRITVLPDGSLRLSEKADMVAGVFRYVSYSAQTVERCYLSYNRNFGTTRQWSEPDFAKPGLQYAKTARDFESAMKIQAVRRRSDKLIIDLEAERTAAEVYGCPRQAQIQYTFGKDRIEIHLEWFHKDANRLPEALFFGFVPKNSERLRIYKLGQPIDPYIVAAGGNRKLHACQRIESDRYILQGLHSPLISIGGRHLYDTDDQYGELSNGLHFLLYNNRWNTNCPVYYGQNAAFDFIVTLRE